MAFAVKLCTSSGVKVLRSLSDETRPWLLPGNGGVRYEPASKDSTLIVINIYIMIEN